MPLEFIRRIINEWYKDDSFNLLLEAVLTEGYIKLGDWESNPNFHVNHLNAVIGPKQIELMPQDFVSTTNPGSSLSKSGYLFLPMNFALERADGMKMVGHIADQLKQAGKVTLTALPGFGIEDDEWQGAYPARFYKTFGAEAKQRVEDQLNTGYIITAINGEPLSRWIAKPSSIDMDTSAPGSAAKSFWGGKIPDWLGDIATEIDDAVRTGRVNVERSRTTGFEGDLVLSTNRGDSVLIISKDPARAAYIIKKKIQGNDWDVWLNTNMKELYSKYRRKPAGTKKEDMPNVNLKDKRKPKLSLRDMLMSAEGGYALRRAVGFKQDQQLRNEIKQLINNGVNYADGKHLADTSPEPPAAAE